MKKIFIVASLASFAALGGCSSTSTISSNIIAIESEVQADANLVCGFVPTIATIASFVPIASSVVPAAASIAESICAAVAAAPPVTVQAARLKSKKLGGRLGAAVNVATVIVPGVGPVPISGQFTR